MSLRSYTFESKSEGTSLAAGIRRKFQSLSLQQCLRLLSLLTCFSFHLAKSQETLENSATSENTLHINVQRFALRKNSFTLSVGNSNLYCVKPIIHSPPPNPNWDWHEDFKINNQSSWANPRINLGYNRLVWHKMNSGGLGSKNVSISGSLGWFSHHYNRVKTGSYDGGYPSYYFNGTVNEECTNNSLSFALSTKFIYISASGKVFGMSIGLERLRYYQLNYKGTLHNISDNQSWVNSFEWSTFRTRDQRYALTTNNNHPDEPFHLDYFSGNLMMNAGKMLSKKSQAGFYLELNIPEYAFYSYKIKTDSFNPSVTSYLSNYIIFTYGIYFNL
jgi:hypothetical protein